MYKRLMNPVRTANHFSIEELIDPAAEGVFVKYINNAAPCPSEGLDEDGLERAEFLCFVQHVQFAKSHGLMFTSDWQGECPCLL